MDGSSSDTLMSIFLHEYTHDDTMHGITQRDYNNFNIIRWSLSIRAWLGVLSIHSSCHAHRWPFLYGCVLVPVSLPQAFLQVQTKELI